MKRELEPLGYESEGFDTLEDAIEFCNKRDGITYAEIGKATQYHVFVAAFTHHFRFYHRVAIYKMTPQVMHIPDCEQ